MVPTPEADPKYTWTAPELAPAAPVQSGTPTISWMNLVALFAVGCGGAEKVGGDDTTLDEREAGIVDQAGMHTEIVLLG